MPPVLDATARPAWIGPPVFALDLDGAPGPDLALYPVCTAARDLRCAALVTAPGAVRIDRSWLP